MTAILVPRMEILPPAQQRLWPMLRGLDDLGFVLYGGTAIALQLGHRASVDFDFFANRPLDKEALRAAFPWLASATVLQDGTNAWTLLVRDAAGAEVKLSFFGGLCFGRVGQPRQTADGVLLLAALEDLLAHKLKVLLQRVEAKDYLDIAALLAAGLDLAGGLAAARLLFGANFQPSEALKAMTWFEGGDLAALPANVCSTLIHHAARELHLPEVGLSAEGLK